ncbi:hypothetical protein N7449_003068 [Penicillium cf. viridicatum]|uniref:AttH domain-containing protein n=1 Tax=Penicillium cf. viridicatum TaxID=2972119 RepID=A0A9W9MWJ1_9EURO|nr:hypothetical protein N7449_003068 [Penicillium cf. viridicatum]
MQTLAAYSFIVAALLCGASALDYTPQSSTLTASGAEQLPLFYNLSEPHPVRSSHGVNSFWMSSFVRTTDNGSYLVMAHTSFQGGVGYTQRGGILSLDEPLGSYPRFYQTSFVAAVAKNNHTNIEPLNLTLSSGAFGLESVGPATDPSSPLRFFSRVPEAKFDVVFDMSAPVILNAGLGSWLWAGAIQNQWSMPAGRTRGSFVVNDSVLTIDPDQSFTWYDRQWGATQVPTFTWFGLHLAPPDESTGKIYFSIWNWVDPVDGNKSFATVQSQSGISSVVPVVEFSASEENVFHSQATNSTYPLEYDISLLDGTHLHISSVRPDQEYVITNTTSGFYSGVMEVTGSYTGYGVADILPPVSG